MFQKLLKLVRHSAGYGFGSIAAKLVAVVMVPLYVRYLDPEAYGIAEAMMTVNLFASALVKLGLQNSMMRFYFDDEEDRRRGEQVVHNVLTATVAALVAASVLLWVSAPALADFFLHDPNEVRYVWIAIFGLWTMVLYQTITTTFRLEKRPVAFMRWSLLNIFFTVCFTVGLVAGANADAAGLLMGNFLGTAVLLPFVLFQQRRFVRLWLDRPLLGKMVRFGVPTMPMAIAVQGLSMVDRAALARVSLQELGLYALAAKMAQVVTLAVMSLQLSWQPFAYAITDDDEARSTYSLVMTYYVFTVGGMVVAASLLADPIVRLLTRPAYFAAASAVPLLAAAAAAYGMYFVAAVGALRVRKTKYHVIVAAGALSVSIASNWLLVSTFGFGMVGAAWSALLANAAMAAFMVVRAQSVFHVPYEWRRIITAFAVVAGAIVVTGLLPSGEMWAVPVRCAGVLAYPFLLLMLGFFPANERRAIARRLPLRRAA